MLSVRPGFLKSHNIINTINDNNNNNLGDDNKPKLPLQPVPSSRDSSKGPAAAGDKSKLITNEEREVIFN